VTSEEWARTKEIFSAAVALAEDERESFLQSQTVTDSILEEVRALLAAYEESPDFLDEATSRPHLITSALRRHIEELELHGIEALLDNETAGPGSSSLTDNTSPRVDDFDQSGSVGDESPPEHIGPYKIVGRLGEGGMGIAYLAERDDGVYRHQVAIKVLKDSTNAPGLIARFQNERQVLAGLDHPYIARLIDGGTTTAGRPYYVMEFVAGESVTVYANSHSLGLRERLLLFLTVCEAVAAAHRQLVVHGDIKPANILVSADGLPKLLYFGLARIIRPANLASYKQAIDYAKHAPPPQVPVPPLVDPPCRSCDAADTPTPGEAQVTAWIKQSEAPEAGYLKTLASIGKQVSNFSGVGKTGLSPAADKALAQFSEADIQAAIWKLSDRLLIGKAIPMAQKYDSEPKRAYAGISFLLKEARDAAQVHGSDYSGSQQAGDLAIAWQQSIAKTIDNDVVAGHKYNLCPVYGTVYRELELLGGSPRQDRPESRLAAPAGAAAESDSPRLEPECPALCSHSVLKSLSSFTFPHDVNCGCFHAR